LENDKQISETDLLWAENRNLNQRGHLRAY